MKHLSFLLGTSLFLVCLGLVGCGQKGPLVRPGSHMEDVPTLPADR